MTRAERHEIIVKWLLNLGGLVVGIMFANFYRLYGFDTALAFVIGLVSGALCAVLLARNAFATAVREREIAEITHEKAEKMLDAAKTAERRASVLKRDAEELLRRLDLGPIKLESLDR